MKIVIDIPDDRYDQLMTDDIHLDVPIFREDIIATLPKGHGRLIDADALTEDYKCYWETEYEVNNAPTIIEADKAESEG